MKYDYSGVRDALLHAIGLMEDARAAAGRTNLYPTLSPVDARRQIDDLDGILDDVRSEIDAARIACTALGRGGLSVAASTAAKRG